MHKVSVSLFLLIFVSISAVAASATAVNVASTILQVKYGELMLVFYETSSTTTTTTPNVNTAETPPTGTGSTEILADSSAYFWSPEFQTQTTLSQGNCVLNLWASGETLDGAITVSIYATNSAGTQVSTLLSSASVGSVGLSEAEDSNEFSCAQATIPADGYIELVLTSPLIGVTFIDWGAGQLTDFQIPQSILS
jgi:hypothetical protein